MSEITTQSGNQNRLPSEKLAELMEYDEVFAWASRYSATHPEINTSYTSTLNLTKMLLAFLKEFEQTYNPVTVAPTPKTFKVSKSDYEWLQMNRPTHLPKS